jgi:2-oxoglutarate dehydrogenase E2 component (dihydrolipoamide succinyltransferase)
MAAVPIHVPGVGESITEGILARWLKPDGASVAAGDALFEFETDKASNVIPAESAGTLKIEVLEGQTVAIGSVVGSIDPDAPAKTGAAARQKPASPAPAKPPETAAAERPKPAKRDEEGPKPAEAKTRVLKPTGVPLPPLSPAVRRLVAEEQVDAGHIAATGPGGRLTKGDVLAHLATPSEPPQRRRESSAPEREARPEPAKAAAPAPAAHGDSRETRERMSTIRQRIAERLVEVQQTAAILTTFNEADMSAVVDLRTRFKDSFKKRHGVSLGFMSFFVKAVVEGLREFPAVNARIDGNEIVHHHFYNIGVAVSTERGLMVPVLRDADRMSFAEIEKAIGELATKARDGKITVNDLQGGTFTITNGGVFGSLLSTPILNPPQSGILGMHAIQKRPVAIDDQVVIRPMMYLALSYDHRIVDGREAVSFLVRVKEGIENPDRLMLEV